jgi:hypothetical protein
MKQARQSTAAEIAELRQLIRAIFPNHPFAIREFALRIALTNPDTSLRNWRLKARNPERARAEIDFLIRPSPSSALH